MLRPFSARSQFNNVTKAGKVDCSCWHAESTLQKRDHAVKRTKPFGPIGRLRAAHVCSGRSLGCRCGEEVEQLFVDVVKENLLRSQLKISAQERRRRGCTEPRRGYSSYVSVQVKIGRRIRHYFSQKFYLHNQLPRHSRHGAAGLATASCGLKLQAS